MYNPTWPHFLLRLHTTCTCIQYTTVPCCTLHVPLDSGNMSLAIGTSNRLNTEDFSILPSQPILCRHPPCVHTTSWFPTQSKLPSRGEKGRKKKKNYHQNMSITIRSLFPIVFPLTPTILYTHVHCTCTCTYIHVQACMYMYMFTCICGVAKLTCSHHWRCRTRWPA